MKFIPIMLIRCNGAKLSFRTEFHFPYKLRGNYIIPVDVSTSETRENRNRFLSRYFYKFYSDNLVPFLIISLRVTAIDIKILVGSIHPLFDNLF